MVLAAVKGRKIDSEPLLQSLADLKEQLYDAEDVMDELDYYRLEEQVASGMCIRNSESFLFRFCKTFCDIYRIQGFGH